jgi:hypothetical protein
VSEPAETQEAPTGGSVWLREAGTRDAELVFDFPLDHDLNAAVKQLPGRWFDWRRRNWRVPADPRLAPSVGQILERFPKLEATPGVRDWMSDSHRWRGLVSVTAREGKGVFAVRTLAGEPPSELPGPADDGPLVLLPLSRAGADLVEGLDGADLDDPARACVREIRDGVSPAPAELAFDTDDDGEPQFVLYTVWDPQPVRELARLSEGRFKERHGRFFRRDAP